jgi:hypothetical protein
MTGVDLIFRSRFIFFMYPSLTPRLSVIIEVFWS